MLSAGTMTIMAQLAPASYTNPQQVQTTLLGTETALDLSLLSPYAWIAQGASANVSLTARVLSNGSPVAGRTVNYYLTKGSGTLNPPSTNTNSNGYATSTLQLSSLSGDVQVSVCAEPGDAPCSTFYGTAVSPSAMQLQPVAGDLQFVALGQSFQPITVRVTDSSAPPNPAQGASVAFQAILGRTAGNAPLISAGDTNIWENPLPIILGSWQQTVSSDANGIASVQPSTGGFQGEPWPFWAQPAQEPAVCNLACNRSRHQEIRSVIHPLVHRRLACHARVSVTHWGDASRQIPRAAGQGAVLRDDAKESLLTLHGAAPSRVDRLRVAFRRNRFGLGPVFESLFEGFQVQLAET